MARKHRKPDLDKIEKEDINPFVSNPEFTVRVNIVHRKNRQGHIHESELESQQYTKLFRHSHVRAKIMSLAAASRSLLFWMCYSVEKTRHCIWLDRKRVMRECGFGSDNTLRNSIKELIAKGFISDTAHQTVYWINPSIFFCGSRIHKYEDDEKYPDKVVVNNPKDKLKDDGEE